MGHRQEELQWETELWDAFPQLSSNVLQSISWLQRFGKISTGLHKLNKDYGKGLAKLVKKESKSGEDGTSVGVCHKGLMQHLLGLAGRHKQIAVSLGDLAREYDGEAKRLIEEHKNVDLEAKKLQGELGTSIGKLDKTREKFEKRQIEADLAEDSLGKAEPDTRVSRAELERLKENADDRRARANRSREEYNQQLLLTNSHQKGFYRETWPKIFDQINQVGKEAGDGVHEMLSKLVSGGLDQWPEPVEAWGEIDNFKELLDFKGDFESFVIWSKTGNPYPKDFSFVEPPKNAGAFTPMTTIGTLRRSISRQSLRYRTSTFPRNSAKFPSMFSLRNASFKSHRRSQSNIEQSTDTIDQIEEEETGNVKKQVALTVSQELKLLTNTINDYVEDEPEDSSSPSKIEPNGDIVSYADIEVEIENEPEKASTPVESEKDKVNPFETSDELKNDCDMKSSEEENPFEPVQITMEMNGIEEENPFEPVQITIEMNGIEEENHCEPIQVDEKMNGIESDKGSVKDNESCEDSVEKTITTPFDSDIIETNGIDASSCKSDKGVENGQAEVDSNDNLSISARNYKYDDRKNPFMDEIFDESLTAA
eukprot:GFUD01019765.1.p1 GENE.GFUD01019765.1~~GFUD01019765.1.p1  ORF type:complete len:595 (+),score=183.04 GFUD01019765.1:305-2089(+)